MPRGKRRFGRRKRGLGRFRKRSAVAVSRRRRLKRGRYKRNRRSKTSILGKLGQALTAPGEIKEITGFNMGSVIGQKYWYTSIMGLTAEIPKIMLKRPAMNPLWNCFDGEGGTSDIGANECHIKLKVHCRQRWINRSNISAYITLYDCVLRKDLPQGVFVDPGNSAKNSLDEESLQAVWAQETTGSVYEQAGYSLKQPSSAYNAATPLLAVYNFPNYTPYMSPTFCHYWKIVKVHKVRLGPGHSCQSDYGLNSKTWTNYDIQTTLKGNVPNSTQAGLCIGLKGKTIMRLISCVGELVHVDSENAKSGINQQTTGSPVIDVTESKTWNFHFDPLLPKKYDMRIPSINTALGIDQTFQMGYDSNLNVGVPLNNFTTAADMPSGANTWVVPASAVVQTTAVADVPIEN